MTKIVLHIGGEKTGTKTLQAFLARNAKRLYQKHGIVYPVETLLRLGDAHSPVAASFLPASDCNFIEPAAHRSPREVFGILKHTIERLRPDLVILSAEHFSSRLRAAHIQQLAEYVEGYPAEIILYVRRQADLAISAFSTALLSGHRSWFAPDNIGPQTRYYNYLRIAADWGSVFGSKRLSVRSYDRAISNDLIADFLSIMGVHKTEGFVRIPRLNERVNLVEARALYLLNQHFPTWAEAVAADGARNFYTAMGLRQQLLKVMRAANGSMKHPSLDCLMSASQRAKIACRFAASNSELAELYGVSIPECTGRLCGDAAVADLLPSDGDILGQLSVQLLRMLATERTEGQQ